MISVILPIYNVAAYLDKCLESILTNTYRDLEVICVNDGSTDECPQLLKKWKEKDPRIVIVDQENRGLPEARNSGLEAASGEYTAFIDPDDRVHPLYFQSMLECMVRTQADMVVSGVRRVVPEEEIIPDCLIKPVYKQLDARQFYESYFARHMVWGRLIRGEYTKELRFPPEVNSCQDTLYNLRVISGIKRPVVYETDSELYYYLQRPGSLVRSHPYETFKEIAEWYVRHGRDPYHFYTGDWAWQLLLQSITMTVTCRYEAYSAGNTEVISHTNDLLQIMKKDLLLDKHISPGYKLTRGILIRFPGAYSMHRALRERKAQIRGKKA